MDKAFLGVLILVGIPVVIVTFMILRLLFRIYQRVRDTKRAMEDVMYNHQSHDYTGRRAQQYHFDEQRNRQADGTSGQGYGAQPRRTQTESGEVIIDHRQDRENKKIFDDSDGEYVEFTEE